MEGTRFPEPTLCPGAEHNMSFLLFNQDMQDSSIPSDEGGFSRAAVWPAALCSNLVGAGGCSEALTDFPDPIQLPGEAVDIYSLVLEHGAC